MYSSMAKSQKQSPLSELILDIIQRLSDEKKAKHIVPSAVLYTEISTGLHKTVQDELNAMVKDGVLIFHRTLNSISFEVKPNN